MLDMKSLKNFSFLIYGLGFTGRSVVKFLKKKNISNFYVWDDNKKLRGKFRSKETNNLKATLNRVDFIVLSPGVSLEKSKYKKFLAVKNNKYFNALQVKFSYAITCHKSQGGQWNTVFVEQPYLPNGIDKDYLRWLYTAITRATEKLYLIGFKDDFFVD